MKKPTVEEQYIEKKITESSDPVYDKCEHENAYYFHDNAPCYCPDCNTYLD